MIFKFLQTTLLTCKFNKRFDVWRALNAIFFDTNNIKTTKNRYLLRYSALVSVYLVNKMRF